MRISLAFPLPRPSEGEGQGLPHVLRQQQRPAHQQERPRQQPLQDAEEVHVERQRKRVTEPSQTKPSVRSASMLAVGELVVSQLSVLVDHLQPHRRELPPVRRVERHGVDAGSAVLRLEQRDPPRSK